MAGKPRNTPEEIAKMLDLGKRIGKRNAARRFGYTPAMYTYFENKGEQSGKH